jgi:thiol-disulfide isomerase/thioredoxin
MSSRASSLVLCVGAVALAGGLGWVVARPSKEPQAPVTTEAAAPLASLPQAPSLPAEAPAEAAAPVLAPVDLPTQPFLTPAAATPHEAPLASSCPLSSGAPGIPPSHPAISNAWQDGSASFVSARQEQSTSRAPLLVYFYTDWCPYCRAFDETVLKDSTFDRYHALRVRVNPEKSDANRALANEFGVDRYPRVFLLATSFGEPRLMDMGTERLGDGSYRFKPPAEIVSDFDRQVANAASTLVRLGYDRRKQGDPATAIRALTEALLIDPQRAEAWLHRGLAEQDAGQADHAYEDFRTALSLQRGYFDVYASVAYDLGVHERWDEAAACWTAYLDGGPRDPRALYERSRAHARRGDIVHAREDMAEACTLGDDAACRVASSLKG